MAVKQWSKALMVNIAKIDEQHKYLIDQINDFHCNFAKGSTRDKLLKLLGELKEYTVYHFSTEEELLDKHQYSNIPDHKKQHEMFLDKVETYFKKYSKSDMQVSIEVINFISDWITTHIENTDMEYSRFLLEKGVT